MTTEPREPEAVTCLRRTKQGIFYEAEIKVGNKQWLLPGKYQSHTAAKNAAKPLVDKILAEFDEVVQRHTAGLPRAKP